jgi:large subunit ribosomal protein L21
MAEEKWMIIETSGKQHFVTAGSRVTTNRINDAVGSTVSAKNLLDGSSVNLTVVAHTFGPKINGLKFKNKVRYLKRYGHRQPQTILEVNSATARPKTELKPRAKVAAKPQKAAK